jgi:hypothetical protein
VAVVYMPRSPASGVLYGVVHTHLAPFLAAVDAQTEGGLPGFVVNEFRKFLRCGVAGPRLRAGTLQFCLDSARSVSGVSARPSLPHRRGRIMSYACRRALPGLLFVLMAVLTVGVASAAEPVLSSPGTAGDGMVIYRDPDTGRLGPPPADAPSGAAALSSGEAVVETPGSSSAGGIKADLRGRFMSSVQATLDGHGQVGHDCVPGRAGE